MENFYIVNVWKEGGYAFLVCSNENLTEDEVITRCKKADCFDERIDAKFASVSMNPAEDEIARYKGYTTI